MIRFITSFIIACSLHAKAETNAAKELLPFVKSCLKIPVLPSSCVATYAELFTEYEGAGQFSEMIAAAKIIVPKRVCNASGLSKEVLTSFAESLALCYRSTKFKKNLAHGSDCLKLLVAVSDECFATRHVARDASWYRELSLFYMLEGDLVKAKELFEKAKLLQPSSPPPKGGEVAYSLDVSMRVLKARLCAREKNRACSETELKFLRERNIELKNSEIAYNIRLIERELGQASAHE